MKRNMITTPFFSISPKAYLFGEELLELALLADFYAKNLQSTIFFVAPPTELLFIAENTKHVVVTSQTGDSKGFGRGMGRIPLEVLKMHGVEATFLNHVENELTFRELSAAIEKCKKLEIISIACANTHLEAKALAVLDPDIILCEPDHLIGTGTVSDAVYVKETIDAIRSINENILIMEGAGITKGSDVERIIELGAQGTGISSTLALSSNKKELLEDLFRALN